MKLRHITLRPGEEVVKLVRPSPWKFLFPFLFGFLFVALAFFLLFPLSRYKIGGIIVFSFLLLFGLGTFFHALYLYFANLTIITNRRIIVALRKAMFFEHVSEVELSGVQDISYSIRGLKQMMFRYGTVALRTSSGIEPFLLSSIRRPQAIQNLLHELREKSQAMKA
jgi:hypothetical protein